MCEQARARKILKYGFVWVEGFEQLVDKQIVRMHKLRMCTKGNTIVKTKIQFNRALIIQSMSLHATFASKCNENNPGFILLLKCN
jgi:hypothetical protein